MELLQALQWRYAVKKMNGQKVPEEKVERILDAIRLAPSSVGLQPYSVIVVTDPELKQRLLPAANNQQQIVDCSHLLVFAAWTSITEARANEFVDIHARTRNMPAESLAPLRGYMQHFRSRTDEENFNWAARQAYIGFGIGIAAAALEAVDATPMEGFKGAEVDALLGLDKLELKSVTLLPLGYRDVENDWLAPLTKVRRAKEDLFIRR